jgi:hypothetical protein
VISIRFDEHPREWRNFFHLGDVEELVDAVLVEPLADAPPHSRGHREIHLGDQPYNALRPELDPMMLVAVGGGRGAVYFRDLDDHGAPVGFVAVGDGVDDPPVLAFNAQGSLDFEAGDVLTRKQLRSVVRAYLIDGVRPAVVGWRESEWVQ